MKLKKAQYVEAANIVADSLRRNPKMKNLKKTLDAFIKDSKGEKVEGMTTVKARRVIRSVSIQVHVNGLGIAVFRLGAASILIWFAGVITGCRVTMKAKS